MTENVETTSASKKKLYITLAVLATLIIVTIVYFALIKKTPKEQYLLAETTYLSDINADFKNQYEPYFDLQEQLLKKSHTQNISAKFITKSDDDFLKELEKLNVKMKLMRDNEKNETAVLSSLLYDNEDLLKLNLIQTSKETALQIPTVYDDYLYLKNKEFGDFMNELLDGDYEGVEELENYFDLEKENEKWEKKLIKYTTLIYDNIPEESVTVEKGKEVNGEKVREITMKLSAKETKNITRKLLQEVQKDDELLTMLSTNSIIGGSPFNQFFFSAFIDGGETGKSKEQLKQELKEWEEDLDYDDSIKGIDSTIYVTRQNKIVKREMNVKGDGESIILQSNTNDDEFKFEVSLKEDDEKLKPEFIFEREGNDFNRTYTLKMKDDYLDDEYDSMTLKQTGTPEKMKWEWSDSSDDSVLVITQKINQNLKKGFSDYEMKFNIEDGTENKNSIQVNSKIDFNGTIKIPNYKKGQNLNDMTKNEMMEVLDEMGTNFGTHLEEFNDGMFLELFYGLNNDDYLYEDDYYDSYTEEEFYDLYSDEYLYDLYYD